MLESIKNVNFVSLNPRTGKVDKEQSNAVKNNCASTASFYSKNASQALKLNSLNFARSIKFTGALAGAFQDLNSSMVTCKSDTSDGEDVGSRVSVNKLLHQFAGEFLQEDDAIKSTIKVNNPKDGEKPIYARTQIKMLEPSKDINESNNLLFEMAVRTPSEEGRIQKTDNLKQQINIVQTPINYKGEGTREQAYVLNTKGNLMAVIEDGDDILLTNAGNITKKDSKNGALNVEARQWDANGVENKYDDFTVTSQPVRKREIKPSIGEGAEIIIGMENNRFVDEIKSSIVEFVDKVNNGDIVLDQFVANENAKSTQLVMLAGGFGSRAEYTNASSSAIFHNIDNGTQSTKGIFRTATGLTPMETTFITLHNAGLLDCSKGALEIGKNIKFYLNKTPNHGSGGYTLGLAKKMLDDDTKSIMVFPNDSISRTTNAVKKAKDLVDSGKAAMALVAKKVKAEDCIKNFGIMRIDKNNNQILEFKEKPDKIPEDFVVEKVGDNKMCLTNAFQFAVSREVLEVMDLIEPFFNFPKNQKETRDWSKHYIPVIHALTTMDNPDDIRKFLKANPSVLGKYAKPLDDETINYAKEILGDKKLYAVPTSEPWADCGTLNQLYLTTMQIAHGNFPLEDFERAHLLSCVNVKTGLVASTPEQKKSIEDKYEINGEVMVVPQAKYVDQDKIKDIEVVVNEGEE